MYTYVPHRSGKAAQFVRNQASAAEPRLPAVLCAVLTYGMAIIPAQHLDRLRLPDREAEIEAIRDCAKHAGLSDAFVLTPKQLGSAVGAMRRSVKE